MLEKLRTVRFLFFLSSENNLALVSRNTCWLDSSATSNTSVPSCLSHRKPTNFEDDGKEVAVEAIRYFRLL